MNETTILLVEDDTKILNTNAKALGLCGYATLAAATLTQARQRLAERTPDLVILDIMLPDGNGLAFCRELRETSGVPVLFLTALDETADMLKGYAAGGVDYIPKPYSMELLLAKVDALLRLTRPDNVAVGPLELNTTAGLAYLNGNDLLLTQKEFGVLRMLVESKGRAVTAEQLYTKVWGAPMAGDDHSVKNSIYRLRRKLENGNSGLRITATRGEGYRLE